MRTLFLSTISALMLTSPVLAGETSGRFAADLKSQALEACNFDLQDSEGMAACHAVILMNGMDDLLALNIKRAEEVATYAIIVTGAERIDYHLDETRGTVNEIGATSAAALASFANAFAIELEKIARELDQRR